MPKASASKQAPIPVDELTYEQAFAELETIIAELEGGGQPLEQSLELFARSQELLRRCAALLEGAALQVRSLSGEDFAAPEE